MKHLRAVIFDMDGVLIDSEPLHERAQKVVFADNALNVPDGILATFKGQREEDVFEFIVREYGRDGMDPADLVRQKHAAYRSLMPELRPIDGSVDFVRSLQESGFRLALTTSAARHDQEFALDMLGLGDPFEVIVTAEDVTRPKPHPEPYSITVQRMSLEPNACLVIEDSLNGVRSALDAGCEVVGLLTSFERAALAAEGAHYVVDSFEQLRRQILE
ncbi:MAG: HAD family phosphatase [Rhodothermia bacterium]|nr:HAD family phosphatase [Rhodothermia bacterium]